MRERTPTVPPDASPSVGSAIARLWSGNARFVGGIAKIGRTGTSDLAQIREQRPFATVFGCSDSRVPAEIIFDQGFGSLFVVRVAGHVVTPAQVASLTFSLAVGIRVIVVLGHARCGAVQLALDRVRGVARTPSPDLGVLTPRIVPAIAPVVASRPDLPEAELMDACVRAHVLATVDKVSRSAAPISAAIEAGTLAVVGAVVSLETGVVELLDDPHEPGRWANLTG